MIHITKPVVLTETKQSLGIVKLHHMRIKKYAFG